MKKLMYGSIALLCLAASFHLGYVAATGSYVDPTSSGIVAAFMPSGSHPLVWDANGVRWEVDELAGWVEDPVPIPLPVPITQIKFLEDQALVTYDDHVWRRPGGGAWVDCGSWPGSATIEHRSWGSIKADYRSEK